MLEAIGTLLATALIAVLAIVFVIAVCIIGAFSVLFAIGFCIAILPFTIIAFIISLFE